MSYHHTTKSPAKFSHSHLPFNFEVIHPTVLH